jgi:hypothetical protein
MNQTKKKIIDFEHNLALCFLARYSCIPVIRQGEQHRPWRRYCCGRSIKEAHAPAVPESQVLNPAQEGALLSRYGGNLAQGAGAGDSCRCTLMNFAGCNILPILVLGVYLLYVWCHYCRGVSALTPESLALYMSWLRMTGLCPLFVIVDSNKLGLLAVGWCYHVILWNQVKWCHFVKPSEVMYNNMAWHVFELLHPHINSSSWPFVETPAL